LEPHFYEPANPGIVRTGWLSLDGPAAQSRLEKGADVLVSCASISVRLVGPDEIELPTTAAIEEVTKSVVELLKEGPIEAGPRLLYNNSIRVVADWAFLEPARRDRAVSGQSIEVLVATADYFRMLISHPGLHPSVKVAVDGCVRDGQTEFLGLEQVQNQIRDVWGDRNPTGFLAPIGIALATYSRSAESVDEWLLVAARRGEQSVAVNPAIWSFPVDETIEHGGPLDALRLGLQQELGKDMRRAEDLLRHVRGTCWLHAYDRSDVGAATGVTAIYAVEQEAEALREVAERTRGENPETGSSKQDIFVGTFRKFLEQFETKEGEVAQSLLHWVRHMVDSDAPSLASVTTHPTLEEPKRLSALRQMSDAISELKRRINEDVLRGHDYSAESLTATSGDEGSRALVAALQRFADRYEDARINVQQSDGDRGIDMAREWENAVRAIARLVGTSEQLWNIVESCSANYPRYSNQVGLESPPLRSATHRFSDSFSRERDAEIFLYCVRLEARRREKGHPERFLRPQDLTQNVDRFFGDPRVFFHTAIAIHAYVDHDSTSRQLALHRRGYALARSALERNERQPGLNHVCALYNLQIVEWKSDEDDRRRMLEQARGYAWTAIRLDPTYYRYWVTRARINEQLGKPEPAGADLAIAKDLLNKDVRLEQSEKVERLQEIADVEMEVKSSSRSQALSMRVAQVERMGRAFEAQSEEFEATIRTTRRAEEDIREDQKKVRSDMDASRREQIQLIAIVAAFIGLIASSAPGVALSFQRAETLQEIILILMVPFVLIIALVIALRLAFKNSRSEGSAARRPGLFARLLRAARSGHE
jgi:hypothetical protein